jgi:flagellar hook assembly protein FlgD
VRLELFDVSGRLVRRLVDAAMPSGNHQTTWDGRGLNGQCMPNGIYLFRSIAGSELVERKMALLR